MRIIMKRMDKNKDISMSAITMQRTPSISRIKVRILKIDKEWWLEISNNSKRSQKKRKMKLSDRLNLTIKYKTVFIVPMISRKIHKKWHWYLILIFSIFLHFCFAKSLFIMMTFRFTFFWNSFQSESVGFLRYKSISFLLCCYKIAHMVLDFLNWQPC